MSHNLAVQFYNTIDYLSMVPTITRTTRNAQASCSLLDNFFITNLRNFKNGILSIDISDLLPIFLIYELYLETVKLAHKETKNRVKNELTLESFFLS